MAGQRQPVQLVIANGKKHLTKQEIKDRLSSELQPITDGIAPPAFLTTKKEKEEFEKIAGQLKKLGIMGETDCDCVGHYIIAHENWKHCIKQLKTKETKSDPGKFSQWTKLGQIYATQCRQFANDLGLSISARCKLVVPQKEEKPKSKFDKFLPGGGES